MHDPIKLDYVSPSAIETAESCLRKWAWTKLDRLPRPQNKWAAYGSEMHSHHEARALHGTPFDRTTPAGESAAATEHWLPPPQSAEVEREMRFVYDGVTFGGKIDLNWYVPSSPIGSVAVVHDHKSCGDLRFVKDTKQKLLEHPQAPIYGTWAAGHYGVRNVVLRWTYATRDKRPKALLSQHLVSRDELAQSMISPLRAAKVMLRIVDAANTHGLRARDLPPNVHACSAYGGCPFVRVCNLTIEEQIRGQMSAPPTMNDFMSNMPNFAAPLQAPAQPPQAPQPPQAQPWAQQAPQAWTQPGTPQAPVQTVPTQPPPFQGAPYGGQINPPENGQAPFNPFANQFPPAQAAAPAPTSTEPPKKRGRRAASDGLPDVMSSPVFLRALATGLSAAAQYLAQAATAVEQGK